ncbi:MAG: hypothetical protein IAF38_03045, partial [Bacteroidia bacterium]|nr:hypothetical protein [Bacteroidia bacterium]
QNITTNAAGAGFLMKLDLLHFGSKKKNGYCFGRMLNLILGQEYVYPLGMNRSEPGLKQNGELAGKVGVGMYSYWGGSSKKHLGWTIHWELYYRHGFTPYLKSDFGTAGNNNYKLSSVGLTCRVIRHKTYKFSDM